MFSNMKLKDPLFLFSVSAFCLPSHSAKQPSLQHRPVGRQYQPSESLSAWHRTCAGSHSLWMVAPSWDAPPGLLLQT